MNFRRPWGRRKSPILRNRRYPRSRLRRWLPLVLIVVVPGLFLLGRLSATDSVGRLERSGTAEPVAPSLDAELPELPLWRLSETAERAAVTEAKRLIELGQLTRAHSLLEPIATTDVEAAIALAVVYERMGDPAEAMETLSPHRENSRRVQELLEFAGVE